MNEWLKPILEKQLAPTAAPAALWGQVADRMAGTERTAPVRFGLVWALVVPGLLLAVAGLSTLRHPVEPTASSDALAIIGLGQRPGALDFQSDRADDIRAWVTRNTGLDVTFRNQPPSPIQLLGARVVKADVPAAEVAFRVGDTRGALLITRPYGTVARALSHRGLSAEPRDGAAVTSWTSHSQRYTLAMASPESFQAACHLCHPGTEAPKAF